MNAHQRPMANATMTTTTPTTTAELPLPRLLDMSPSVYVHCVAMLVFTMLVVPIVCCTSARWRLHSTIHCVGLIIMTIGVLAAVVACSFSAESIVHAVGGIGLYAGMLASALVGGAAMTPVRDAKVDSSALRRTHAGCARTLLYVGFPLEALTGVVAALHLADERLSGALDASLAVLESLGLLVLAGAYAYVATYMGRSTRMPELLRAYSTFAAEAAGVFVVGVVAALGAVYFEFSGLATPPSSAALVHALVGRGLAGVGVGALIAVRASATRVRHIPPAIVSGPPVLVVCCTLAIVSLVYVRGDAASPYARSSGVAHALALALAALARYARFMPGIAVALAAAAAVSFTRQRGIERLVAAAWHLDGRSSALFFYWAAIVVVGAVAGVVVNMCCLVADPEGVDADDAVTSELEAHRRRVAAVRRRRAAAAAPAAGLAVRDDDEVSNDVAELLAEDDDDDDDD
jgi:hypothetical protein